MDVKINNSDKKYFVILPGFGETGKEKPYKELAVNAGGKGFDVHIVEIQWNFRTLSQWIKQVEEYMEQKGIVPKQTILFGFSFGAEIALFISNKQTFSKVLLASPSPYFSENLQYIPQESKVFFGVRRIIDFEKYLYTSVRNLKSSHVIFFFGENDWDIGIQTSKKIAKKNDVDFFLVPKSGHELTIEYLNEIKNKIRQ